jgi:filamentous hemagglutinin
MTLALRANRLQVTGEGTLIAGANVNYQTAGDILNNGTIAAKNTTVLAGNNISNLGNRYSQTASTVVAPQGNISISGKQVDIVAGINTEQNTQETKFKQQGVTVQITNPVISAVQTMMSMQEAKQKTKNGRSKALADAATATAAANAAAAVAGSAAPAGGVDLAFSIGSSSNQSNTVQNSTTAAGSTVSAKGTTSITATGAGQQSNLTLVGSEVTGTNVNLKADNQINLIGQRNNNEEHSTNKGSSASVGFSVGSSGFMVNASASGSRGKGDGSDSDTTNTHVKAVNQLAMTSGGDTTIRGATASGKQVTANVGTNGQGNLNIESLQDTSQYKSQQQSLGGSISAGVGKVSGSINASRSKVEGNYQSVTEQSGILAGDGGFKVNVNGNTDLKGGKIASTDKAVTDNKNSFTTASLTTSDIRNKSDYKAESQSFSAGGGYGGGNSALNGTGIGFSNESGSASSTTTSGVSGIAGDKTVRSDKDNSNALKKTWNGKELQQDVEAQARIMETFGKEAAKGIGTYATKKLNDLKDQITAESDPAKKAALLSEEKNWAEGGAYRTALHAAAGALGGGLAGAAGATASAVSMPAIAAQIDKMDAPNAVKQALAQVAAGVIGAAVGGTQGMASAVNVEANNRQLHTSEKELIAKKANGNKNVEERLTKAACYAVQCWAEYPENSKERAANYVSVMDAYTLKDELAWVHTQQQRGQFVYSSGQQVVDYVKKDVRENVLPAVGNSIKVATGGLSTAGGYTLCSTTGIGCIPGAWMIAFGASNITEGATGLYNQYQGNGVSGFNPIKQAFNQALPGTWGNLAYAGVDFGVSILSMRGPVPLNIGLADGLGRPTSMFGVTVSKIDNPMLLPFSKLPLPVGTGVVVATTGAIVKASEFGKELYNAGAKK